MRGMPQSRRNGDYMKINLPNKLTILRVLLVPVFMLIIMLPLRGEWSNIIGAAVFILTALTDTFDGIIARRRNLITDFGKFMDPLADKFMVFGAMLAILVKNVEYSYIFVWVTIIVILRELAITSMRLVIVGSDGKVIAAKFAGKVKTTVQIVAIVIMLLDRAITSSWNTPAYLLSYIAMGAITLVTLWSGYSYIKDKLSYIDMNK